MLRSFALVVSLFILHLTFGADSVNNNACALARVPGTCKPIVDCPEEYQKLEKGWNPTSCGWNNGIEIVCCSDPKQLDRRSIYSKSQILAKFQKSKRFSGFSR